MSTSPVTYPPGSTAKTKKIFDQVKEEADDDSAYDRDRATAARLDSLETFMQAHQAVQISMQKQQADFLGQQAIFMQQVLQQMGPTIDKQVQDKQTKQTTQDKQVKDKQITDKQIKDKQKTDEAETQEDQERRQLGVVGSSSLSATAVGAWHDS